MYKPVVAMIVTTLIALTPLEVMAQASAFDEASRSTAIALAQQVGHTIAPSTIAGGDDVTGVPEPQPTPLPEEPEAEPESPEVELPELNLTDLAEYSSQGVTINAPADWIVDTDIAEGVPFVIEVPGTDLQIGINSDSGLDYPSWFALTLFRTQPDILVKEIGEDAEATESTTLYTSQNLPVVKLAFLGTDFGEQLGGAIYLLAPNEQTYLLAGSGSPDEWNYAAPGLDLIAQSITFDDDLLEVVQAGDEPMEYADEDETVMATVPAGWYAMSTGDSQFPLFVSEPEARFVAALGTEAVFDDDEGLASVREMLPAEGELDPSQHEALITAVTDLMNNSGSPIELNEELSQVTARDGAVTVRLVGNAVVDEGMSIPVMAFIDLRPNDTVIVAVFGDTESAMALGDEFQSLVESVTGL